MLWNLVIFFNQFKKLQGNYVCPKNNFKIPIVSSQACYTLMNKVLELYENNDDEHPVRKKGGVILDEK